MRDAVAVISRTASERAENDVRLDLESKAMADALRELTAAFQRLTSSIEGMSQSTGPDDESLKQMESRIAAELTRQIKDFSQAIIIDQRNLTNSQTKEILRSQEKIVIVQENLVDAVEVVRDTTEKTYNRLTRIDKWIAEKWNQLKQWSKEGKKPS